MSLHGSVSLDASEAYKELRAIRREMLAFAKETASALNLTATVNLDTKSLAVAKTALAGLSAQELKNAKEMARLNEINSRARLNDVKAALVEEKKLAAQRQQGHRDDLAAQKNLAAQQRATIASVRLETAELQKRGAAARAIRAEDLRDIQQIREAERQADRERREAARVTRDSSAQEREATSAQDQLAQDASTILTVAGTAVLGGAGVAVNDFVNFDRQLRNINTVAKLSEAELQKLGDSIIRLSSDPNIRKAPDDLADALYDIYSSGLSGTEALDALKNSAYGASAGLTETKNAAGVTLSVIQSGIKGVNGSKEAMDVLFKTVDRGRLTFEELSGVLGAVLPTASKAGITLQELGAYLAVATKQGQSASEATNDLLNLITKIANPGKEARGAFDKLGIAYGFSALQGKGLKGVLEEIQAKTGGNADVIKKLLPDMQAQRGALTGLTNAGRDYRIELEQQAKAFEGAGAAAAAMAKQNQGASFEVDQLAKEFKILRVEVGESAAPAMRTMVAEVRDSVKWFNGLDKATKDQIVQFSVYGGAALLLAGRIKGVVETVKLLKEASAAGGLMGGLAGLATNPVALGVTLVAVAGGYALVSKALRDTEQAEKEATKAADLFNTTLSRTEKLLPDTSPYVKDLQDLRTALKEADKDVNKIDKAISDLKSLQHKIEIDPTLGANLRDLLLNDIRLAQRAADDNKLKVQVIIEPLPAKAMRPIWEFDPFNNKGSLIKPGRPIWDLSSSKDDGEDLLGSITRSLFYPSSFEGHFLTRETKKNLPSGSDFYRKEIARANGERMRALLNPTDYLHMPYTDAQYRAYLKATEAPPPAGKKKSVTTAPNPLASEETEAQRKAREERERRERQEAAAAMRLQKDQLDDLAKHYDLLADSSEKSARRQIDAIKGVENALQGVFGTLEDEFAKLNAPDALSGVVAQLDTLFNLGGRQQGIAAHYGAIAANAKAAAQSARSQQDLLQGGDGINADGSRVLRGSAPRWLQQMEADSGKSFGRNCAMELSARLKGAGADFGSMSAASLKKAFRVAIDESGRLPAGTVVRYPPGKGGYDRGHYMAVGSDSTHWTESNFAGPKDSNRISSGKRAINWRQLQRDIANGTAYAFAPGGLLAPATPAVTRPRTVTSNPANYSASGFNDLLSGLTGGSLSKYRDLGKGWGGFVGEGDTTTARRLLQELLRSDKGAELQRDTVGVLNSPIAAEIVKNLEGWAGSKSGLKAEAGGFAQDLAFPTVQGMTAAGPPALKADYDAALVFWRWLTNSVDKVKNVRQAVSDFEKTEKAAIKAAADFVKRQQDQSELTTLAHPEILKEGISQSALNTPEMRATIERIRRDLLNDSDIKALQEAGNQFAALGRNDKADEAYSRADELFEKKFKAARDAAYVQASIAYADWSKKTKQGLMDGLNESLAGLVPRIDLGAIFNAAQSVDPLQRIETDQVNEYNALQQIGKIPTLISNALADISANLPKSERSTAPFDEALGFLREQRGLLKAKPGFERDVAAKRLELDAAVKGNRYSQSEADNLLYNYRELMRDQAKDTIKQDFERRSVTLGLYNEKDLYFAELKASWLEQGLTNDEVGQMLNVEAWTMQQEKLRGEVMTLLDGLEGDFKSGFKNLFEEGPRGFFDSLLSGFQNTLSEMASAYLSSQVRDLLGGLAQGILGNGSKGSGAAAGGAPDLVGMGYQPGSAFPLDGSHRSGLDRVPFDGYRAELHAGEAVLSAESARQYRELRTALQGPNVRPEINALREVNKSLNPNVWSERLRPLAQMSSSAGGSYGAGGGNFHLTISITNHSNDGQKLIQDAVAEAQRQQRRARNSGNRMSSFEKQNKQWWEQ